MTPRIEAAAAAAAEGRAARVAAALADVPGVSVVHAGAEVIVRGRGLARRRIEEPALRWPDLGSAGWRPPGGIR